MRKVRLQCGQCGRRLADGLGHIDLIEIKCWSSKCDALNRFAAGSSGDEGVWRGKVIKESAKGEQGPLYLVTDKAGEKIGYVWGGQASRLINSGCVTAPDNAAPLQLVDGLEAQALLSAISMPSTNLW